jgi:nitroimidazol reductase NimA-like FMN-containing flavoprotein (pyridoxamine 5'-phosphate oxidase superfamily)
MLRKDKEIIDRKLISQIIKNCEVCRLGLAKDNSPYIIPVSFGYDGEAIYFHTTQKGKKLDYIKVNNELCFEFEYGVRVLPDECSPCNWSFSYQSVIGYGHVQELIGIKEKREGLNIIIKQYSDQEWDISEEKIETVRVWKIIIKSITGKQSKDKFTS